MEEFEKCDKCKHNMKLLNEEPCCRCVHGVKLEDFYTPKTNADRIRAMSDEELAELLASISDHCLAGIGNVDCSNAPNCDGCKKITLRWLKSEVKEEL